MGANLSGADLSLVYMEASILIGANLSGTTLRGANLSKVNMRGADLSGADLMKEELSSKKVQSMLLDLKFGWLPMPNQMLCEILDSSNGFFHFGNKKPSNMELQDLISYGGVNGCSAKTNLSGADLSGAILNGVNIINNVNLKIEGARFSKKSINQSSFYTYGLMELAINDENSNFRAAYIPVEVIGEITTKFIPALIEKDIKDIKARGAIVEEDY
jgi:uncharacterized protein YjbI with pentapeptide repeats